MANDEMPGDDEAYMVPFMHAGNAEERYECMASMTDAIDMLIEMYGIDVDSELAELAGAM